MITDKFFCVPERLNYLSLISIRFICFDVYTLGHSPCYIKHKLKCSFMELAFHVGLKKSSFLCSNSCYYNLWLSIVPPIMKS